MSQNDGTEPPIFIETFHQQRRHWYTATNGDAVHRFPIRLTEIWNEYDSIPDVPAAGLINDGDIAGVVELFKSRALAQIAGTTHKFELAATPADLAEVITATTGQISPVAGSAAPTLTGAPATGYTPVIQDAIGAVFPMQASIWVADGENNFVEFPYGVPPAMVPPFALTFFRYIGVTGGGAGGPHLWERVADTTGDSIRLNLASGATTADDFVFPQQSTETPSVPIVVFDTSQGAFRAGNGGAAAWLAASRGTNSAAFGLATIASGGQSFAAGSSAVASASDAVAFGSSTAASGTGSVAFGFLTAASGTRAFAAGSFSSASGSNAAAFGTSSSATMSDAFAAGNLAVASAASAAAFGSSTTASGAQSFAANNGTTASGDNSAAFGSNTTASGLRGFAANNLNVASGPDSTATGSVNTVSGSAAATLGGFANLISGADATGVGGALGTISGNLSVLLGGLSCTATSTSSIVGGDGSSATGGTLAIALGTSAAATGNNQFIWSDTSGLAPGATANSWWVAAQGGSTFFSNAARTTGVVLAAGASAWAAVSDRNAKENLVELDGAKVLALVDRLPIYQYNYKGEDPAVVNRGPVAQDWHAAFPSAKDPLRIDTMDLDGITLAAVKGLVACVRRLEARLEVLEGKA